MLRTRRILVLVELGVSNMYILQVQVESSFVIAFLSVILITNFDGQLVLEHLNCIGMGHRKSLRLWTRIRNSPRASQI